MHIENQDHRSFMPRNLAWFATLSRLAMLNEFMVVIGAVSMHAVGILGIHANANPSLLYQVVWMHCVGCSALFAVGVPSLWTVRRAWRRMPQPIPHYEAHGGAYPGLPRPDRTALALSTAAGIIGASAMAWWMMGWFTPWLRSFGPAPMPPFELAVFNTAYGTLVIYVFEFFRDRAIWSHHREQRAQKLGTQAQLDMLRSQLEPHMLFNTLANVNDLIDEDPDQAKAMLHRLIDFLRATLQGSLATQHPLHDEFKLIGDYLAIMQIRMGERLNVSLQLPPELASTLVPAMLLQPLVENAIQHGVAPRRTGGSLHVDASACEQGVHIRIRNTGGVPAVKSMGQGVGMRLVSERLQAQYGAQAHLQLQHLADEDTTQVSVFLPSPSIQT